VRGSEFFRILQPRLAHPLTQHRFDGTALTV
jgi:hypothetical protein